MCRPTRSALLAVALGVAVPSAGCSFLTNPFPWGDYSVAPVATPAELRLGPETDVATFQLAEPRADLSREMTTFPTACLDCPQGSVGPIEPAEFTTHGLTPLTVTVHVDRTGLTAGEHTGYAYVHTKDIQGTPKHPDGALTVPVTIIVPPS
jgi:hypothetical protein